MSRKNVTVPGLDNTILIGYERMVGNSSITVWEKSRPSLETLSFGLACNVDDP